jgi:hypothetical protein
MELVVPVGSSIHLISGTSLALLLGIKNHADDTLIYIDHYLAMYSAGETPTVVFFPLDAEDFCWSPGPTSRIITLLSDDP